MMQALVNIPINFSSSNFTKKDNDARNKRFTRRKLKPSQPLCCRSPSTLKVEFFRRRKLKTEAAGEVLQFSGLGRGKNGILCGERRRVVAAESNKGFNGLGGDGGGGKINGETARVLGNLALAVLLTYLSMTGQLGWLVDAVVSLWLLAVLVPIIGIGAFVWWAGRDIIQSNCPNCGNEFQVFKSALNEELQLCPFCTQPFAVEGDRFVSEPVKFSNRTSTFNQAYSNNVRRKNKGKESSAVVVDIEAEIRDAE